MLGLRLEDLLLVLVDDGAAIAGGDLLEDVLIELDPDGDVLELLVLVLPLTQLLLQDVLLELEVVVVVFVEGHLLDVVLHEGQAVDVLLHLLDAVDQAAHPDGGSRVLAVVHRDEEHLLLVVELGLGLVELLDEEVHDGLGLVLDGGSDGVPLGQVVEGLQHLDAELHGRDRLEGRVDDLLVHDVQLFHLVLEGVELLVPLGGLHVEYLVLVGPLDLVDVLEEDVLDFFQDVDDLGALGASELGDLDVVSFPGELQLTFADFP